MSNIRINTVDMNGLVIPLALEPSATAPWTIRVSGVGFTDDEFVGDELFAALVALRLRLEQQGKRLLCAGARRDVYPSGMARSMGSARKAYVINVGEQATEMIDIFDPADQALVGTVAEQRMNMELWISSLRAKLST